MRQIKKIYYAIFVFIFISLLSTPAIADSAPGQGIESNPYVLTTCSQLQDINNDLGAYYILRSDIDCNGFNFSPIQSYFTGTLDGRNHTISNLNIYGGNTFSGIFDSTLNATIENLNINGGTLDGGDWSGSLVGDLQNSSIINVHSNMNVNGGNHFGIGGLVGMFEGTMSQSSYSGTITGGDNTGGLAGEYNGGNPSIDNSYFDGNIIANGQNIGGITGDLRQGSIDKSYSSGTININGQQFIGGLVGLSSFSNESLTNSFSATHLVGSGQNVGGIFGTYTAGLDISNVYFDQYLSNDNDLNNIYCSGIDTSVSGCTRVNVNNSNSNYFINNTNNPPLNNWDFNNLWFISPDNYPKLKRGHKTKPVIHLYGLSSINVLIGGEFNDPGAYSTDADSMVLMHQISVSGTVNTSKVGSYLLSYDVCDNYGNCADTTTRTVYVAVQITQNQTYTASSPRSSSDILSSTSNKSNPLISDITTSKIQAKKTSNSPKIIFALVVIILLVSSGIYFTKKYKK